MIPFGVYWLDILAAGTPPMVSDCDTLNTLKGYNDMEIIRVAAHIDESGRIEIDQPNRLPPGDVIITIERISAADEAADESRWAASFARSQEMLAALADEALRDLEAGLTDELNPDTL